MADRVFCIDLGSAYTKVALRRDPTADSQLLEFPGVGVDFWVPTVIAVDRRGTKPRVAFGDEAADQVEGGGIDVHRNWKRAVFRVPPIGQAGQSPLELLLHSDELQQLASKFGVPRGQVACLQQLVGAARSLISGPGARPVSADSYQQSLAAALAAHFFHWLRQRVLEACAKLPTTGLKFEEIPLRMTVPALVDGPDLAQHPGCKLLREALHKAGWPLHTEKPFVTEPFSNTIGILTKASNILHRSRIHLGEMFGKGPLITVLKDTTHYPSYRALVIDVGAFTTDFAALTLKLEGEPVVTPDMAFDVKQLSLPLAVGDLDERFRASPLAQEKLDWLGKANWREWATLQRSVYAEGKGYRVPNIGVIGGDADRDVVRSCLDWFAGRLAEETAKFCGTLEPVAMQELILTGGGSSIPVVREALQTAAQANGKPFVKTHAADLKRVKGGPQVDKLDERFARGGSALGGASIYFERDYY
jgi:hypothetical protein